MNSINFLRLVGRSQVPFKSPEKYSGFLHQLVKRSTSANVSSQKTLEKKVFQDALPGILDNLITSPKISQIPEISSWIKKVLEYNLSGGKHSRGLITMCAYEMMEKPENITTEYLNLAKVLGWCIEMLQGYFCMVDDVMDGSSTRRGVPCWYRMPNVGMGALNDSILMKSCISETLEKYFLNTPHFVDLIRLFHEATLYTSMGQHIDYTLAHRTKQDFSQFTIDRYDLLVKHKTSYYTFRLPVLLGLTLVKDVDKRMYDTVDDISFKLGKLFQMQDDYIDCFGDSAITGKIGTDIQEGKCSWLAVSFLKLCNESQKERFIKHYGSKDPEHVADVKQMYVDLRLPELYKQTETEIYDNIVMIVNTLSLETAPKFYYQIIDTVYKRIR